MQPTHEIYRRTTPNADSALRQGELLTNLKQYVIDAGSFSTAAPLVFEVPHPFVVVLTQDCDLDQDFHEPEKRRLPSVLFGQIVTATELRGNTDLNSRLWERIPKNKDERYHFFQKVEAACDVFNEGLPELATDFKKYFTLPRDEVYRQIESGITKRRCVLVSPYLEHLSSRFAQFLSRVALPEAHFSAPATP